MRLGKRQRHVLGLLGQGGYLWRRHVRRGVKGYSWLHQGRALQLDASVVRGLLEKGLLKEDSEGNLHLSDLGVLELASDHNP